MIHFNAFILIFLVLACAPAENYKDFGDREKYYEFGPKTKDIDFEVVEGKLPALEEFWLGDIRLDSYSFFNSIQMLFSASQANFQKVQFQIDRLDYSNILKKYQIEKIKAVKLVSSKDKSCRDDLVRAVSTSRAYNYNRYLIELESCKLSNYYSLSESEFEKFSKLSIVLDKITVEYKTGKLSLKEVIEFIKQFPEGDELAEKVALELVKLDSYKKTNNYNSVAHRALSNFYINESNFTTVEAIESPYLEAALGLYGADLFQMYGDRFSDINANVNTAFSKIKIGFSELRARDLDEVQPIDVVLSLDQQLRELPEKLKTLEVDPAVVSGVSEKISELDDLMFLAKQEFSAVQVDRGVQDNLDSIDKVISELKAVNIFPSSVFEKIAEELKFPRRVNDYFIAMKDKRPEVRHSLGRSLLVEIWRYLSGQLLTKEEKFKKFSASSNFVAVSDFFMGLSTKIDSWTFEEAEEERVELEKSVERMGLVPAEGWDAFWFKVTELSSVFEGQAGFVFTLALMDEEDLDWLSRSTPEQPIVDENWTDYFDRSLSKYLSNEMLGFVEDFEGEGYNQFISAAVNKVISRKLSGTLMRQLDGFDSVIERQIYAGLAGQKEALTDDFYGGMKDLASKDIVGLILGDKTKTPAMESSKFYYGKNNINSQAQEDSLIESSGTTHAVSLSALSLSQWQPLAARNVYRNRRGFQMLNKAVATIGVKNFFGSSLPSLALPIFDNPNEFLDIYTYNLEPRYFGVPEQFYLKNAFEIDTDPSSLSSRVSARSVSESIFAAANFLETTADWRTGPFDDSLFVNEYQGIEFFPKTSVVELGLAMASLQFNNLKKMGIRAFDKDFKEVDLSSGATEENSSKINTVAIVDALAGVSNTVDLQSMAKLNIAVVKFIRISERLFESRSNANLVISKATGSTQLDELQKNLDLLRKLSVALTNFVLSKMLNEDFSIASSFDIQTNNKGPANILSSALMLVSILQTHSIWGGDSYLWAAQDLLYQMNHRFLRKHATHYSDEGAKATPEELSSVAWMLEEIFLNEDFLSNIDSKTRKNLDTLRNNYSALSLEQ
ncbi:MAG: hypothetical protein AB8E15_00370 [Bdellovibrionales bacterium]